MIELYHERGYGKLVEKHKIQVDSNSKNDWKYKDVAQLLWTQVSKILRILAELEKCRKDLTTVLDNVTELYKVKEYPVGHFVCIYRRLFPIFSKIVLLLV